jgi:hypothetical protein
MRKPRSKFKVGQTVNVTKWTRSGVETGVIASVHGQPVSFPNREGFTLFRYMVKMDNAVGVFGAGVRFVHEYQITAAVVAVDKAA